MQYIYSLYKAVYRPIYNRNIKLKLGIVWKKP